MGRMKEIYIMLRDLVYSQSLPDKEIVRVMRTKVPEASVDWLMEQIAFVKDNPLCPDCNISLSHFSIEQGIPEHLYCPHCMRAFQPDFPYTQMETF
jgi:rubredoxin